jgi:hypothetical protein
MRKSLIGAHDPEEQKLGSDLASVDLPIPPCLWRAPTANTVTSVGGAASPSEMLCLGGTSNVVGR